MNLCDMHCHSSGISKCCKISYTVAIDSAKEAGFNSIVLTNHYTKDYFIGFTNDEFINKYYQEFENAFNYGKSIGINVIFGVEVTMEFNKKVHLLIYGITVDDLKETPNLYDMSIEEIYDYCNKHNFALIQAHPFRNGTSVLDVNYLDGIEVNCHPIYKNTYSKELIECSLNNNLAITCGNDYHGDVSYRPKGGLFLPDNVINSKDLVFYLKNSKEFNLQIQEINDSEIKQITITLK